MRYEGKVFRPPSEADAFILQATIGCSWNKCTYCDMYRDKSVRGCGRSTRRCETSSLACQALRQHGADPRSSKVFVADGDALVRSTWSIGCAILSACRSTVSISYGACRATPWRSNVLDKSDAELAGSCARLGLDLLLHRSGER